MKVIVPEVVRLAALGAALLCAAPLRAQDSSTVQQAFAVARTAVAPPLQTKVVSLYGLGTPDAIGKWYIIFYDPKVPTHGRVVFVENGKISKVYDARGGATYRERLTFDPSRITSEQPALNAAQNYASRKNIAYNGVHVLLKQVEVRHPFRWRIELMDNKTSRGFVMVNAVDDSVAGYSQPPPPAAQASSSASDEGNDFGHKVQRTFLGIGGDLEEFFTGERTVDR